MGGGSAGGQELGDAGGSGQRDCTWATGTGRDRYRCTSGWRCGRSTRAAAGSSLGTVAASMMLPGVGPVVATGIVAALLLGAGGAVIGAAAGKEVEDATEVHPAPSDVFFCEERILHGHLDYCRCRWSS